MIQAGFAFGKHQHDVLLQRIRSTNEKLDRLLQKSEVVASYQNVSITAVSGTAASPLVCYWKDADRLYTLMDRSWSCQCHENHCAYLWLEHRTMKSFEFKLLVLWSQQCVRTASATPWDRRGLRITRSAEGLTPPGIAISGAPVKSGSKSSSSRKGVIPMHPKATTAVQ